MRKYFFNGVELKEEAMQQTRQWFHDNCIACIEEAKEGRFHVNDLERYIEWETKSAIEYMEGKHDRVLAFLQRAYYFQTGESVALLK